MRTRTHWFAVVCFAAAAIGMAIVILTTREVLQDLAANPRFQADPGYRQDAINGSAVYVMTQLIQLVLIPLGLGIVVHLLARRSERP